MVGRGLAFDLSDVGDISTVEVFVDGIQVVRGVTNGILSAGQPPVFSITQTGMGPRLTLLLALTSSDPRQATTVAIAGRPMVDAAASWLIHLVTPSPHGQSPATSFSFRELRTTIGGSQFIPVAEIQNMQQG